MVKFSPTIIQANKHSSCNRAEVLRSRTCGCFYCFAIFKPSKITKWINEGVGVERTALCPECGIDSVIGSDSGFPTEEKFLKKMNKCWFSIQRTTKNAKNTKSARLST